MPRIELHVNGRTVRLDVEPERSLLSVLREDVDLTGSKYGCGEGQCGACTVLVDGAPRRSCLVKAGELGTKPVITIEALARDGELHPLQQAFLDEDALQCGYCTSGMLMAGYALLQKSPSPSDEEITEAMKGNLCRCGVYRRIAAAIKAAAQKGPR